jgi:hypothetical protein
MRVAYLANVGTRDLQRGGEQLKQPRKDGEDLLAADWNAVRSQLSAPILAPGLRHVLQQAGSLVRLQLLVTDQPPPRPGERDYRPSDTLNFGKLLQRLLTEQFGPALQEVAWEPMRFNPADYNETLGFFAKYLPLLVPPETVDFVYIAPVGGTDACNAALTIHAVQLYRDKCQFIYVMPWGDVQTLYLSQELLAVIDRREAAAHLSRHDYMALRQTLQRAQLGKEWQRHLCDYADRRTRFDFRRAREALQEGQTLATGEAKLQLARLAESLDPFLQDRPPATSADGEAVWQSWFDLQRRLLAELYFNLRLKRQQNEWVDFLGRLFRLQEAVLRLVFELKIRHSTAKHPDTGFRDFDRGVRTVPGLPERMEAGPDGCIRADTGNLSRALGFWVRSGEGNQYGPLHERLAAIGSTLMAELRNKSIGAHGYHGVSREDVEDALNRATKKSTSQPRLTVDDLLDKLRDALHTLGVPTDEAADPYARVQSLLRW